MKASTSILAAAVFASATSAWQTPENLGDVLNTQYDEWYPVVSEDGSWMVFVSTRPGGCGSSDLWISFREGGEWGQPVNLGAGVNTAWGESAPYLAEGDTRLYFLSMDPAGFGGGDIWYCPISEGVPGARVHMGAPINSAALECCPLPSHDGTRFYFCSTRSGGSGEVDVWISEGSGGVWGTPYNAGSAVNSTGTDCPRWISDDDQTLLICSTGPGGYGGADMYSTGVEGDSLGAVVSLGPVLNSPVNEWGAGFLDNMGMLGGTILFGSGRSGGFGGLDIWSSTEEGALDPATWGSTKAEFAPLTE